MNIDEVQRRLWEQSQRPQATQGVRNTALSDQPVRWPDSEPDGPDAQSHVDCGSL